MSANERRRFPGRTHCSGPKNTARPLQRPLLLASAYGGGSHTAAPSMQDFGPSRGAPLQARSNAVIEERQEEPFPQAYPYVVNTQTTSTILGWDTPNGRRRDVITEERNKQQGFYHNGRLGADPRSLLPNRRRNAFAPTARSEHAADVCTDNYTITDGRNEPVCHYFEQFLTATT